MRSAGGVRTETGTATMRALQQAEARIAALERRLATAVRNGYLIASHTDLEDIGTNTHAQIDTHVANTSNPHSVTHTQVNAVRLYNQAAEPAVPSEPAIWYQPRPDANQGGRWHFSSENMSAGTWQWVLRSENRN